MKEIYGWSEQGQGVSCGVRVKDGRGKGEVEAGREGNNLKGEKGSFKGRDK